MRNRLVLKTRDSAIPQLTMIDAHIHVVPPNLPGVGPLSPGLRASPENVARVVREQMLAGGFTHAAAMGAWDAGEDDPLGVKRTVQIAEGVPGPVRDRRHGPPADDRDHLRRAEAQILGGRVVALKGYLGYVHHFPTDPGYLPYYELAAKYKLPVFFHTGDTYSPYAKLKFAHPLLVDEVAVDFPQVKFVLCHVGNPWTVDAAEVVYKNMNVWVDLSGLARRVRRGLRGRRIEPSVGGTPSTGFRRRSAMPSGRTASCTGATGRSPRCRPTPSSSARRSRPTSTTWSSARTPKRCSVTG